MDIPRIFNAFNTRFLPGLSFALNYRWGALNPVGYRSVNVLIHCLNAFLVYLLMKSTLGLFRRPQDGKELEWPAFFASMLFLCHPIQTEPVNFVIQRFVLMGSFFYLLTLFLYIQYRCRKQKRYLFAGMASAIAAMFCKEFVVTLPLMLTLYDLYFLHNETIWKRCKNLVPFFVIALIVPLLLLRTPPEAVDVANIADSDLAQEDSTQKTGNHIDITRANGSIGRKQYFLTELNVVRTYVRLLFLPVHQDFDYDYPISHGTGKDFLSGLFLLCLLVLAAVTYRSYRLVSFGILWFFIALSVESSFIPIAHVIAEYRLYLASVGFVFLVTSLIYMREMDRKQLNMIAAVILMGFSVLTYHRNKVWTNELTLWNDTVQRSPHKARPYSNRGVIYSEHGDFTQAISDFDKSIEINPNYADAYVNRGITYGHQGKLNEAIADFTKTIAINPKYVGAYNNRGTLYGHQGRLNEAIADFTKAVEINSQYAEAYFNRGIIYYGQKNFPRAISDCTKAIEINPVYAEAYYGRGLAYESQNNFVQAVTDFNKAIEINPDYELAHYDRGRIYYLQNDFTQAISEFNKTIAINPHNAMAYYFRGLAYEVQNDLIQAISDFTNAIEISPNYAKAYYNRGLAYAQQGQFTQTISDLTKAIEINPNYVEAYDNRGTAYDRQKNFVQAVSDYTEAIKIDPKLAQDYNNRGYVYAEQGQLTQALTDLEKAIEINPTYAEAYNNRGFVYFKKKEYDKAWADVHKAETLGYKPDQEDLEFRDQLKQASGRDK